MDTLRGIILLAALLPVLFWMLHFRDPYKVNTSWESIWTGMFIGAMMTLLLVGAALFWKALLPESYTISHWPFVKEASSFTAAAILAFLSAALPEEMLKLAAVWMLFYKNPETDKPHDLMVLAVAVSLGFAAFENVLYVINAEKWSRIAMIRSVTAVPGHAFYGVVMGSFLGASRLPGASRPAKYILFALCIPIMMHGIHNIGPIMEETVQPDSNIKAFIPLLVACSIVVEGMIALRIGNRFIGQDPSSFKLMRTATNLLGGWRRFLRGRFIFWGFSGVILFIFGVALLVIVLLAQFSNHSWILGEIDLEMRLPIWNTLVGAGLVGIFHGVVFIKRAKQPRWP